MSDQPIDERHGLGRWSPIDSPRGVLWTNDDTAVGFQPGAGVNPAAADTLIEMAPGTPTEVFDYLVERIGARKGNGKTQVTSGLLDTWEPARA